MADQPTAALAAHLRDAIALCVRTYLRDARFAERQYGVVVSDVYDDCLTRSDARELSAAGLIDLSHQERLAHITVAGIEAASRLGLEISDA